MNKLSLLLCTTALTAAFVGATDRAHAGSTTETLSYGPTATPYGPHTFNFVGWGGVGTLTSVVVTLTESVIGSVTGTNTTGHSLHFNSSAQNTLTMNTQPAKLSLPTVIDTSAASGSQLVHANSFVTVSGLTGSKTVTSTATGSLNDFLTAWSLSFSEVGSYFGTADSGMTMSAATTGKVSVTATYTYSASAAIPEPMSLALLGSGLAGLGVIRRCCAKA